MKVLKGSVSLILVFMMIFSASVFAADTVVGDYYMNNNYDNKQDTEYITENNNTYRSITTNNKKVHYTTKAGTNAPTQNLVIKFDFRISSNTAENQEIFIASVTNDKELKVFQLYGTSLRYYYSTNAVKDSGITVTPDEWHGVAVEYSVQSDGTDTYSKTYDLYYDGIMIADDVVDGYTDQTKNTISTVTLYVTKASETAPVHFDNVQCFDGALDKDATISFKSDVKYTDGKLVVDSNIDNAKTDVTAALESGILKDIYTDATLATVADKVTDGCIALVATSDNKFTHKYELTTKIFEETFDENSDLTEQIATSIPDSVVTSNGETIYDRSPLNYTLSSSALKSLSQTADDKYCRIYNENTGCVLNSAYPRITLKNVFPLSTDFTSEMSLYVTGNASHGMDIRLSSGNISLGADSQDLNNYNYNSWNKVCVQVDFEEGKVTASLFINGKFIRSASKNGDNLSCTGIRYFSHPLNTLSEEELIEIYNAGGADAVSALTPELFDDAIDNIRIKKGMYDASGDVLVVNSEYKVKENKVYADLTNLDDFAQSFAGDKLVKIVNNDETNAVKEGTLIFVKANSNDFWNVYTVTDATFKVLSFEKNEDGKNATAVFNNHTDEAVLLIAAIYENGTYVNMHTKSIDTNADTVTLAEDIVLSAGQTVKYMLLNSLEGLVPYCGAVE